VVVENHHSTADQEYEAELHEPIASMVPSVIQLLEHEDQSIRLTAVDVIDKLANHGEW
jgi:hypothetical protein